MELVGLRFQKPDAMIKQTETLAHYTNQVLNTNTKFPVVTPKLDVTTEIGCHCQILLHPVFLDHKTILIAIACPAKREERRRVY